MTLTHGCSLEGRMVRKLKCVPTGSWHHVQNIGITLLLRSPLRDSWRGQRTSPRGTDQADGSRMIAVRRHNHEARPDGGFLGLWVALPALCRSQADRRGALVVVAGF